MENQNSLYIFHDEKHSTFESTFKEHKLKIYDYHKDISSTYLDWNGKDYEKTFIHNLYWTIRHARDSEEYKFVTVVSNPHYLAMTMGKLGLDNNRDCMYECSSEGQNKIIQYRKVFSSIKQLFDSNIAKQNLTSKQYDLEKVQIIEPFLPSINSIFNGYQKAEENYLASLSSLKEDFADTFDKEFKR